MCLPQAKAFSWTACSVAAYVRTLDLLRSAGDSDRLEEEASTRMCGPQQFVIVPVGLSMLQSRRLRPGQEETDGGPGS